MKTNYSTAFIQSDSNPDLKTPIKLLLFVHKDGLSPNPLCLDVVIKASLSSDIMKCYVATTP
jgi:hypothetical protein